MKTIKLLGVVIVSLVLASITVSNHSLDDSLVVRDLNHEIKELERNNTILRAEIATSGSLTAAAESIKLAGYVSPTHIATLTSPGEVALK